MSLRLLEEAEADDPILSVVNLIDVFLVIIAALLLAVADWRWVFLVHVPLTLLTLGLQIGRAHV